MSKFLAVIFLAGMLASAVSVMYRGVFDGVAFTFLAIAIPALFVRELLDVQKTSN